MLSPNVTGGTNFPLQQSLELTEKFNNAINQTQPAHTFVEIRKSVISPSLNYRSRCLENERIPKKSHCKSLSPLLLYDKQQNGLH